jgi:hypothetical protein
MKVGKCGHYQDFSQHMERLLLEILLRTQKCQKFLHYRKNEFPIDQQESLSEYPIRF